MLQVTLLLYFLLFLLVLVHRELIALGFESILVVIVLNMAQKAAVVDDLIVLLIL